MARKATDHEERALAGEQVISEEALSAERLPFINLKVVYLGGNVKKTVRLKGQIIYDPDDPTEGVKKQVDEGFTMYDFSVEDTRGRRIRDPKVVTDDGRRFQMVSHYGHLLYFYDFRGSDKERQFELRGTPADSEAFKKYRQATRRRRPGPDDATKILADMADMF